MEEKEESFFDDMITSASDAAEQARVEITDDSLEKANFSKHTYRLIAKARRKGKRHKMKLPYLQYNLTKSKPRPMLVGIAIFSAIVMLLSFAGAIYSFIAGALPLIKISADSTGAVENMKIPIVDLFAGVGVVIMWLIVVLLLTAILAVVLLLINNTFKLFNFFRSPVEEFAYSHETGDLISNFVTTGLIAFLIGVGTLFANSTLGWIFGIAIIVIGILFIVSTILLVIERRKAREELANTDPTRLESIKSYFADIRKICKYRTFTQIFFGRRR